MVKSFALISVVVATGLGLVNGAPIKFTRDAPPVVQREQPPSEPINRRFPQALAADTPGLAARNPEEVTRRFPRRVHYEYYMKREVDPHRRDYTADEPSVIARELSFVAREPSPEEIARDALNARNVKRSSRRSTAASEKDLFKRTLKLDGVKARSPKDEPTQKRAIREMVERAQYEEFKAKREPTPEPQPLQKLDSRALDKLEVRDSPVRESRAFVPRAPASHYPASAEESKRDNYVWNIHNGDETIVEVDLEMIAACVGGASPCSSTGKPGNGGKPGKGGKPTKGKGGKTTTTGTSTATDTSTATGTVTDTPTSTTTSSSSTATSTGTNAGDAPPGGAQVPPHGGANGTPHSDTTSTATSTGATTTETGSPSTCTDPNNCPTTGTGDKKKKPVDTTVKPPTVNDNSPHTGGTRRDVKMDELLARTPSAKWRRLIPAPSLKRSVKSAPAIQFAR